MTSRLTDHAKFHLIMVNVSQTPFTRFRRYAHAELFPEFLFSCQRCVAVHALARCLGGAFGATITVRQICRAGEESEFEGGGDAHYRESRAIHIIVCNCSTVFGSLKDLFWVHRHTARILGARFGPVSRLWNGVSALFLGHQ